MKVYVVLSLHKWNDSYDIVSMHSDKEEAQDIVDEENSVRGLCGGMVYAKLEEYEVKDGV